MRYAIIEDGVVVNVTKSAQKLSENWVSSDDAQIGWGYEDGVFSKPEKNVDVPASVSALQGLLAIDGANLASAYEAWATDPSRTFAEKAFIDKATTWHRTDPVLISGASALGLNSEQIDALFIAASKL